MAGHRIIADPDASGWQFRLTRRRRVAIGRQSPLPVSDWTSAAETDAGVSLLLSLMDAGEASASADAVSLTHARTAALSRVEPGRLNLPPICPLSLFLSHDLPIGEPGFRLQVDWLQTDGQRLFGVQRVGTSLTAVGRHWLLLDPLYSALQALDRVNQAAGDGTSEGLDRRMAAYAELKGALVQVTGDLRADEYLRGLTIHCATGLGIDLHTGNTRHPFLPTLYGSRPDPSATSGNERRAGDAEPEPTREPLLPSQHAKRFSERFAAQGARSHYVLGSGVYTVLDAPIAAALDVVAQVNRADDATHEAFRHDPMAYLTPAIEAAGGDGGIICQLRDYGERVTGVGAWVTPSFSFPLPVSRDWFPDEETELFTIALPNETQLIVRKDDIQALRDQVSAAQAAGQPQIIFNGQTVPISAALAKTVNGLIGQLDTGSPKPPAPQPDRPRCEQSVLLTRDNEERLLYQRQHRLQQINAPPRLPVGIKSDPKAHQQEGIAWLQQAYAVGAPGLLLADDMGLGKTYQVLVFLKWLRDGTASSGRKPVLVVAPKSLIGNWAEELDRHLDEHALGPVLRLQDQGLRALREVQRGNDLTLSRATLDVARLERAGLVLTSYETLRDYQLSFAQIPFRAVVFDEAQRVKNPASMVNRAAKGQQGDFTLLMTGTPIENSLVDLWTLLDIAWPGFLNVSLSEFLRDHRDQDADRRARLKQQLTEPSSCTDGSPIPPIMLRRFKAQVLDGLPRREVKTTRDPMPAQQQAAYDAVRAAVRDAPGSTLQGLQQMRAVALHPQLGSPPASAAEDAAFIHASARFSRLFAILDDVRSRNEKALVFVDLREAQRALYDLIQRRYGLPAPRPEIINGATTAAVRDRIRQAFQTRSGFDVLLLGPKAAGLGLTLTAANHVIHLNRWWNPAVEDQCSDRVYRIGQTRPVTIHLPLAIHPELGDASFDALLHGLLEEKRALSREIVVPIQFNEQDFRKLYQQTLDASTSSTDAPNEVDHLDWRGFEHWVAGRLRDAGLQVDVTPGQGDGGVDVVARATGEKPVLLVQCKHTGKGIKGLIGEAAVEDLLRAQRQLVGTFPRARLLGVSNGRFSLAAENFAVEHGVRLVDATALMQVGSIASAILRE